MIDYWQKCALIISSKKEEWENIKFASEEMQEVHLAFIENLSDDSLEINTLIYNKFEYLFDQGFRKIQLIIYNKTITDTNIIEGFKSLKFIDCSVGAYSNKQMYLFGTNMMQSELLKNIDWKAPELAQHIIKKIGQLKLSTYKTPTIKLELNDTK